MRKTAKGVEIAVPVHIL